MVNRVYTDTEQLDFIKRIGLKCSFDIGPKTRIMTIQTDDERMMAILFTPLNDMILQKWCVEKNADNTYDSTVIYERSVCDIEDCNFVCDIEFCNVVNECNNMLCYMCTNISK